MPAFSQIQTLADMLRDAARTEIMPRFRNLGDHGVRRKKSAIDVVTEADEAAERRINAALAAPDETSWRAVREAFFGA